MTESSSSAPAVGALIRFGQALRLGVRASGRGVIEFYKSDNLTFASSIAYYSLLSMFPFMLLVLAVLGSVTVADRDATLLQLVTRAVPGHLDFLEMQIQALSEVRLNVGIVGFILAVWGSLGVFGAITSAINHAWGVEERPSFWKHKLIALCILATAGLLLMATLLIMSSAQVASADWFTGVIDSVPLFAALRGFAMRNLPVPLFMLVAGLLYYFVPNAQVRLRDVWAGAFVAALLWRGAFAAFSWYASDLTHFKVLGQVAAVALFLVWIYFSAVIFLYGVEVTAAYSKLRLQRNTPPPPRPEF